MKIEAWILAVVSAGTGEQPWAEIHPSKIKALHAVANCFGEYLSRYPALNTTDELTLSAALDEVAEFTIEPIIIDTDELEGM